MRTAIFADLHDNYAGLASVLADADAQKVDAFVFLGDAGHKPRLLAALQVRQIPCVYGNWEVSGLRRMPEKLAAWVSKWPAILRRGDAIYCHASPDMPAALSTTAAAADWLKPGMSWSALFPRLHQNGDALWNALAWMESHDARVLFHGHTHVQTVWVWELTTKRLRSLPNPTLVRLTPGVRIVVGVGSAGAPEDGPWPRYAIYDDTVQTVLLRCLRDE
ncbi:MAG: phosphoesterase [Chloroflexota bacterium]|jgi:predicted phosphodiesterase|nr:metallophosphoesterase [Caldilinea sp.]GIK73976.1 MAG: phosphoesterase [Chloroflexota bacterium]